MDAPNPSATPTFASRTPLHIGAIALKVRDLDRVSAFYRDGLGLEVIESDKNAVSLGAGGVPFVHLEHAPNAKPDDTRTAGLYHTAFLLPTRGDLARWLLYVSEKRVPLTGASDHFISEAIYLDDPEGNGVEVYCDRPTEKWEWTGDSLKITTDPLDLDDLVSAAGRETWAGAPGGTRIGHVHLRVGNVEQAEKFYRDEIGLAVTRRRGGASFMSSGRYHHHIAGNVWHSNGAGRRDEDRAGLTWFSFETADAATFDAVKACLTQADAPISEIAGGIETSDPWGTRVRVVRGLS
jgi:catechol 2,3-dioxygenase